MQKNAAMVEQTMNTSYQLYTRLLGEGSPASAQALDIAKDIHEIKKEYHLITRGIGEALEEDPEDGPMEFRELWQLLSDDLRLTAKHLGVEAAWQVSLETNFQTRRQYPLLSILRNLLDNALEAAVDGRIAISFSARNEGSRVVFTVADRGRPISPESLEHLFDPGFSTKINYSTGQIGRGVGLCLVRDLVEQELGGTLTVRSGREETVFTVSIPKSELEE